MNWLDAVAGRALDKYDAAFRLIDFTNELDDEKKEQEQALKLSLHLNRSLVHQVSTSAG